MMEDEVKESEGRGKRRIRLRGNETVGMGMASYRKSLDCK